MKVMELLQEVHVCKWQNSCMLQIKATAGRRDVAEIPHTPLAEPLHSLFTPDYRHFFVEIIVLRVITLNFSIFSISPGAVLHASLR